MGNDNLEATNEQTTQEQATQETQGTVQTVAEPQKESELTKANAELQIELRKQKKMIDQYSSQISALKKQLNEKIVSEGEKVTQQTEEIAEIKEQLAKANRDIAFRNTVDSYMVLGMDKEYATKVAQMKIDGEEDSVNTLLKGFIDSERKRVKEETTAELYKNMPSPVSGNGDGQIDYEKIYQEKLAANDVIGAIHAQRMAAQQKANVG